MYTQIYNIHTHLNNARSQHIQKETIQSRFNWHLKTGNPGHFVLLESGIIDPFGSEVLHVIVCLCSLNEHSILTIVCVKYSNEL